MLIGFCIDGSSLASYVPSKLSMSEFYELGVTRSNYEQITAVDAATSNGATITAADTVAVAATAAATTTKTVADVNGSGINGTGNGGAEQQQENSTADDYLKPAAENENVAYSEESIPDLLF